MPQAMAMQSKATTKSKRKKQKTDLLFLEENFCGWADHWDTLKDELHVIAVVLDKTSFLKSKLSVPAFIAQFIMSCSNASESYMLFLN